MLSANFCPLGCDWGAGGAMRWVGGGLAVLTETLLVKVCWKGKTNVEVAAVAPP